jgi:hypothetical protein
VQRAEIAELQRDEALLIPQDLDYSTLQVRAHRFCQRCSCLFAPLGVARLLRFCYSASWHLCISQAAPCVCKEASIGWLASWLVGLACQAEACARQLAVSLAPQLSAEDGEKLRSVRPSSLAQAQRIPGVTPAALLLLLQHVKRCLPRQRAADQQQQRRAQARAAAAGAAP